MRTRIQGLNADVLFVGMTRPAMRWGVPYVALLLNALLTTEAFLMSKNLLTFLVAIPVHGVCALLCARDARFFDLLIVWAQTRAVSMLATLGYWRGSSYSALRLDFPNDRGRRREVPIIRVAHRERGSA